MTLEESVHESQERIRSWLSTPGQKPISHEECGRAYREAIKIPWYERVLRLYHKILRVCTRD